MIRALVVVSLAGGLLGAATPATADLPVYTDSLSSGWQNWSWSTTVDFANASPVHGASGRSIATTFTGAWAGFFLRAPAIMNASDLITLRFSIHGGAVGGQSIYLVAFDAANNPGTGLNITPSAGSWSTIEVPITAFGISTVSGLVWQEGRGAAEPTFYLDDIVLVTPPPPDPGVGPNLTIDVALDHRPISPDIYGMNFADAALATELRLPVRRWGGNATTRYNWQNDTSNRASDWFFENIPNENPDPGYLPNGSSSDRFIEQDRGTNTQTIMTIPLIGWTPKARQFDPGFSVARYGPQRRVDPDHPDAGNGIRPDGSFVTGNDPSDTSVVIGTPFVQGWIQHMVGRYGNAASGGVKFYNLDNEPALWNSTHRDVHPQPVSYDELRDRSIEYAAAIKAADPTAKTLGPAEWGWSNYFYSALDVAAGGAWWDTRPDRRAHGDVPLVDWYLRQMQAYEQSHGVRLLDYLDLHFYPQESGVALKSAGDAVTQALRLRSTRGLWDQTYIDESWIADVIRMIPRMRELVAVNYPGTKIAMTEYNWGGLESINGALAQADVLGIFGREGLDLATMWEPPQADQPGAFAFRVFRNYDGNGASFGDTSVRAVSADQGRVAVYAALRTDGALTIVLINKAVEDLTSNLTLANFPAVSARLYRYSEADLGHIVRGADLPLPGGTISLTLPASSITLLVASNLFPGDITGDGAVNASDVSAFVAVVLGTDANPAHRTRSDMNGDGAANGADVQPFVAALIP